MATATVPLDKITKANMQAAHRAAEDGTLHTTKVRGENRYQLRSENEVLIDNLNSRKQALDVLCAMSEIEHGIVTPPWLEQERDRVGDQLMDAIFEDVRLSIDPADHPAVHSLKK